MNACYVIVLILEIFSSKFGNFWCIFSQKSFALKGVEGRAKVPG
jgi:hypothetical protein